MRIDQHAAPRDPPLEFTSAVELLPIPDARSEALPPAAFALLLLVLSSASFLGLVFEVWRHAR